MSTRKRSGAGKTPGTHSLVKLETYALQIESLQVRLRGAIQRASDLGLKQLTVPTESSREVGLARLTTWIEHVEKAIFSR